MHSHTTTNAPFLANRESFKTFFLTLNASPLHKTQKSGVHLPKIKPYLHHWVKNVQFANCVLYKWTLRLFGHLLISREKNTFHTGLLTFTDRRYSICLNNSFVDFTEKQSRGDKTHIRLKVQYSHDLHEISHLLKTYIPHVSSVWKFTACIAVVESCLWKLTRKTQSSYWRTEYIFWQSLTNDC